MFPIIKNKTAILIKKIPASFSIICFLFNLIMPVSFAQSIAGLNLPIPGEMVSISPAFQPAIMKGITVNPDNPLLFDFLIDIGQSRLDDEAFKTESTKLIKYFLASLTVPEEELWVNLSPYEDDRIIPDMLGETEMGRDLLGQDYVLKQLTASLLYPENDLGSSFWNRVYEKTYAQFGTTDIPINTFNKIWIVPEKAVVYEHNNTAFIVESRLKVMLEEDYVALNKSLGIEQFGLDSMPETDAKDVSSLATQVIKEIVIPEIEKEVNEGQNFANLRQIYQSMILSSWYKIALRESLLGQVYADQNKTKGIDLEDKQVKFKIYDQYLKAFNKGVYDFIKEDYDPKPQDVVYRKYISGGVDAAQLGEKVNQQRVRDMAQLAPEPRLKVQEAVSGKNKTLHQVDAAMMEVPASNTVEQVDRAMKTSQAAIQVEVDSPVKGFVNKNGELTNRGYIPTARPVTQIVQQMTSQKSNEAEQKDIEDAWKQAAGFSPELKEINPKTDVVIYNSPDVNFGIAQIQKGDGDNNRPVFAVERKFLDEVRQHADPTQTLARMMVAVSAPEGKRAEAEFTNRDPNVLDKVRASGLDAKKLFETLQSDYFPTSQSGQVKSNVMDTESVFKRSAELMVTKVLNQASGITGDALRTWDKRSSPTFDVSKPNDGTKSVRLGYIDSDNEFIDGSEEELALRAIAEGVVDKVLIRKSAINKISQAREKALQGFVVYTDSTFNEVAENNKNRRAPVTFVHLTPPDPDTIQGLQKMSNAVDLGRSNKVEAAFYFRDLGDINRANAILPSLDRQILDDFVKAVVPGVNLPTSKYETQKVLETFGSGAKTTTIPGLPRSTVEDLKDPEVRAQMTNLLQAIKLLSDTVDSIDKGEPVVVRGNLPVLDAVRQVKSFRGTQKMSTVPPKVLDFVDTFDEKSESVPSIARMSFGDMEMPQSQVNTLYTEVDRLRQDHPETATKLLSALYGNESVKFTPRDRLNLSKIISNEGYVTQDQGAVIASILQNRSASQRPTSDDFTMTYPKPSNSRINTRRLDLSNVEKIDQRFPSVKKYGGINLNPKLLDLQIKRDEDGIPLPLNQQPLNEMKIDGFLPFIIQITPVTDLQLLLGINPEVDKETELSKAG